MLKFSEIFEFSRENSYFDRIRTVRMVRMVRSLADRTFQLRYQPKTSIEQGIRKTYDWYTANHRPAFLTGRFTEKVDLA